MVSVARRMACFAISGDLDGPPAVTWEKSGSGRDPVGATCAAAVTAKGTGEASTVMVRSAAAPAVIRENPIVRSLAISIVFPASSLLVENVNPGQWRTRNLLLLASTHAVPTEKRAARAWPAGSV
jgi:hypothetical protein